MCSARYGEVLNVLRSARYPAVFEVKWSLRETRDAREECNSQSDYGLHGAALSLSPEGSCSEPSYSFIYEPSPAASGKAFFDCAGSHEAEYLVSQLLALPRSRGSLTPRDELLAKGSAPPSGSASAATALSASFPLPSRSLGAPSVSEPPRGDSQASVAQHCAENVEGNHGVDDVKAWQISPSAASGERIDLSARRNSWRHVADGQSTNGARLRPLSASTRPTVVDSASDSATTVSTARDAATGSPRRPPRPWSSSTAEAPGQQGTASVTSSLLPRHPSSNAPAQSSPRAPRSPAPPSPANSISAARPGLDLLESFRHRCGLSASIGSEPRLTSTSLLRSSVENELETTGMHREGCDAAVTSLGSAVSPEGRVAPSIGRSDLFASFGRSPSLASASGAVGSSAASIGCRATSAGSQGPGSVGSIGTRRGSLVGGSLGRESELSSPVVRNWSITDRGGGFAAAGTGISKAGSDAAAVPSSGGGLKGLASNALFRPMHESAPATPQRSSEGAASRFGRDFAANWAESTTLSRIEAFRRQVLDQGRSPALASAVASTAPSPMSARSSTAPVAADGPLLAGRPHPAADARAGHVHLQAAVAASDDTCHRAIGAAVALGGAAVAATVSAARRSTSGSRGPSRVPSPGPSSGSEPPPLPQLLGQTAAKSSSTTRAAAASGSPSGRGLHETSASRSEAFVARAEAISSRADAALAGRSRGPSPSPSDCRGDSRGSGLGVGHGGAWTSGGGGLLSRLRAMPQAALEGSGASGDWPSAPSENLSETARVDASLSISSSAGLGLHNVGRGTVSGFGGGAVSSQLPLTPRNRSGSGGIATSS